MTYPQYTGKRLDTFLRKDIAAGFKNLGYCAKPAFPKVERPADATTNEDGQWSSRESTAEYVAKYCNMRKLTKG